MEASDEQFLIASNEENNNIVVEAVAGSGKTTTAEYIAMLRPDDNILLLTYNKRLRLETKERVAKKGLLNITVHNYHSFAVKHYDKRCFNDTGIVKHTNKDPITPFKFTIIIFDEMQDMTKIYYNFSLKIIKDNVLIPMFYIFGDRYQSIYDFNGADQRFIVYGDIMYKLDYRKWSRLKLSETYRVSNEQVQFINNCMLKENRMISNKHTNIKPFYLFCDAFKSRPFKQVMEYLKSYTPSDIFILAPSVKSNSSPVKVLANSLTQNNIHIYVPMSDEEKLDNDIIKGKLVFSSFHQVKGLERKVIIVFSFDKGYFEFCNRTADPFKCTNALYVAVTRSLEHLTLIHDCSSGFLPFLNKNDIEKYCDSELCSEAISTNSLSSCYLSGFGNKRILDIFKVCEGKEIRVIDLILMKTVKNRKSPLISFNSRESCNNFKEEYINEAIKYVTTKIYRQPCSPNNYINLPMKTKQLNTNESVVEINEIAIPSYYEFLCTEKMEIVETLNKSDFLKSVEKESFTIESDDEKEEPKDELITYEDMNVEKLLLISTKYACLNKVLIFKLKQIAKCDWLTEDQLLKCIKRLSKIISINAKYNVKVSVAGKIKELRNKVLEINLDCIDKNNIYKFVCSEEITSKHILEHCLNMYCYTLSKNIVIDTIDNTDEKLLELYKKKENLRQSKLTLLSNFMSLIKIDKKLDTLKAIDYFLKSYDKQIKTLELEQNDTCNFYIFNIVTFKIISIKATTENLKKLVDYFVTKRFYNNVKTTDAEFLSSFNVRIDDTV